MEKPSVNYQQDFTEFTKNLFFERSVIFHWLGIVFFPLFSLLDYFSTRQSFEIFLVYRLCFALILLLFVFILIKKQNHKITKILTFTSYLLGGLTISLMVLDTGGYGSHYYVGLLLISVGAFALLPLTVTEAISAGLALFAVYALPLLIFYEPTPENLSIFFSNSFFFVAIIIISLVQCHEETKARTRRFSLGRRIKSLNKDLSFYTHNLEDEVEKRIRKIEESKLRYRELYENILDLIVVLDSNARILIANQHFYLTFRQSQEDMKGVSFMDIVASESKDDVEEKMLPSLFADQPIKNFQFKVKTNSKQSLVVECNARKIFKEKKSLGFQLVIRDISERKKMEKKLFESFQLIETSRTTAILALAKLAEFRDKDTGNHLERIREYSKIIASQMAKQAKYKNYITQEYIDDIYLSSILHDIGKVGIPDNILLKPGKLTPEEYEAIKCHSIFGGDTLTESERQTKTQSFLALGKQIAYYHHEKWNGTGYPDGLKENAIPLSARIVALADAYDALTSQRCYKSALSHEKAREIIIADKGIHFDPAVVDAFLAQEKAFQQCKVKS